MYFDNYDAYYTYIHTHKIPGTRVEVNKIKAYSLKKKYQHLYGVPARNLVLIATNEKNIPRSS